MQYSEFLKTKKHNLGSFGFEPNFIPDIAFDFQREIITRAVKKGRIGLADTGFQRVQTHLDLFKHAF